MKKGLVLIFSLLAFAAFAQNKAGFAGKWMALDEQTSRPLAIIELQQNDGKWTAQVLSIIDPEKQDLRCQNCPTPFTDRKVAGMQIISGLKLNGNQLVEGELIDPRYGKTYSCYLSLEEPDRLKVRGYWFWTLFGKSQYWRRVKS